MQGIFEFVQNLLAQAEFWAVSTTGFGATAIVSLLWNNRTQLTLLGQKTVIDGLKTQLEKEVNNTGKLQSQLSEQLNIILKEKELIEVLNSNLYILAQSANIGAENKELIAKNYALISSMFPQVKIVEKVVTIVTEETTKKIEEIEEKSTLDELIDQVK